MDVPLLINRSGQKTITEKPPFPPPGHPFPPLISRTFNYTYDNYFYGKKASEITSASDCSLVRGSTYAGYNAKVEVNHGYSMTEATEDSKKLNQDTTAGITCKKPTQSYWGGNSPINAEYKNGETTLGVHRYDDFSQPILDLSAGKTTTVSVG